ncbi:hypothetical protein D9757_002384 [Collybiopsis confluens]|uniref:Uncharacterized protein n=1 Tax=Collybiopsis confluens TaxID=2823264 RepID=A0A8H5HXT6_9AGAR|nr:hypothetical protein D9757_002384 [Collybiopsis confluens]
MTSIISTEEEDISSLSSTTFEEPQEPESLPPLKPSPRQNVHIPVLERRRSSYNSAVTLPPLQGA